MSLLRVNSIETGYGGPSVLRKVSLSVEERQIATLVGSNGAGKTTMLRALSAIIRLYSGAIFLDDSRIDGKPPHEIVILGLAHIPQGRQLFPKMTVEENLTMGAYTERAAQGEKKTMEHVYTLFPRLRERNRQFAGTLSGGEQQMLAIGRGLMSSPRLLVFDEPSLGLAPMLVAKIFSAIKQINKEGITVFLVEQNVRHALAIADQGFVLENGVIILEGLPDELINNPKVKKSYLGG